MSEVYFSVIVLNSLY